MNVKNLITSLVLIAPNLSFAQNEALIACKAQAQKNQAAKSYLISLTDMGNIVIEDETSHEVVLFMPITDAQQLQQNDSKGLRLTGAKKRMGMTYKEQKISVNYASGKGSASENSRIKNDSNLLLNFQECKKL